VIGPDRERLREALLDLLGAAEILEGDAASVEGIRPQHVGSGRLEQRDRVAA
jgi:hypothetical protein